MFDERFVRMWRYYLAGSIAAFETGTLQLFQVLVTPYNNNDVPAHPRLHVSGVTRLPCEASTCRGWRRPGGVRGR